MKYIGIDYSMNSPGICILDDEIVELYSFINDYRGEERLKYNNFLVTIKPNVSKYRFEIERYFFLATKIMGIINTANSIVLLEGYSMGSKGVVFNIAENTATLKNFYYQTFGEEIPVVAPTTIKKFATGKGNAKKDQMYESFVEKTKFDLNKLLYKKEKKLGNPVTDLVDAYWIALYARYKYETREESKT